ncbi:hypothetical protein K493DRAFT_307495 [Basidiobolus meristosporus CBS 931.73]|uniref:Uncharacterized protein n=1 Tax=Basidiobolus meristosporus CBS 931.73 TaxID=1314790 RepID=A0A1Y1XEA6_9FUNG|nr:hypothetical protein K493DRAFT_307495 [Basidiobolus meristosporus CBS 931.73]|eukprot:ORX84053.1 hypothetical protein K493DRAFT_307495 [Basidiobolus meristosporus CBS 931.73]
MSYGLDETTFGVLLLLPLCLNLLIIYFLVLKRASFKIDERQIISHINYRSAIQFPVLGVRHFITQLVGFDLVKTDQKIRGMVVQSVFDGNAYLIDPQALNSSTDIADGTEEVKGEPKASKKLVLSAVDQSATGVTINSRYLTRMKEEDVPLILSSNLSVYRIPESKVITYLGSIGSLCVASLWIYSICAATQSLRSLGYIPGAKLIRHVILPGLFIPLLCKTSLCKGPVFVDVKGDDGPFSKDYIGSDIKSNGLDVWKAKSSSDIINSTHQKLLFRYRIQRVVGSLIYMLLYYAVYFAIAALATMDTDTVPIALGPRLSKFIYWFNASIAFCKLAEPVMHCLACFILLGQVVIRHPKLLKVLSIFENTLTPIYCFVLSITNALFI